MRKKFLAVTLSLGIVYSSVFEKFEPVMAGEMYGIEYDDGKYTACFNGGKKGMIVRTYTELGHLEIGRMYYTLAKFRSKKPVINSDVEYKKKYEHVVVVKMMMEPFKNVDTFGCEELYIHDPEIFGVSEYLKVNIALNSSAEIIDWEPKNVPESTKWTIGFGASINGSGPSSSVSMSTQVEKKQLEMEADIQQSKKCASFIYNYKPEKSISGSSTKNTYVRNTSTQVAMLKYYACEKQALTFSFNSNFAYAGCEDARPNSVSRGSEKGRGSYKWVFK